MFTSTTHSSLYHSLTHNVIIVCLYSQASFSADGSTDISIDDPHFWDKWAERAKLDLDELANKVAEYVYTCLPLFNIFSLLRTLWSLIHHVRGDRSVVMAMTIRRK